MLKLVIGLDKPKLSHPNLWLGIQVSVPPRRSVVDRSRLKHATSGMIDDRREPGSYAPRVHWCACPKASLGPSRPSFIGEVSPDALPQARIRSYRQLGPAPPAPEPSSGTAWKPAAGRLGRWGRGGFVRSPSKPLKVVQTSPLVAGAALPRTFQGRVARGRSEREKVRHQQRALLLSDTDDRPTSRPLTRWVDSWSVSVRSLPAQGVSADDETTRPSSWNTRTSLKLQRTAIYGKASIRQWEVSETSLALNPPRPK